MRIVNTMRISKEKAVLHYVDLIVKVFEKNSEIAQGVVCVCVCVCEVVECQLRTSKSGVWLDQNWIFVDRGEEGVDVQTLDFLADVINE